MTSLLGKILGDSLDFGRSLVLEAYPSVNEDSGTRTSGLGSMMVWHM